MTEHLPHHEKHEQLHSPEQAEAEPKRVEQHETHYKAEHNKPDVEALHHKIEKEAKSAKEVKVDNESEKNTSDHYLVNKELKEEAYKRSLQRARKHMTASSRGFSKVIHQPFIDAASKVGEKTIARPTGILTGAIVALIGTSYVLWTAKHYGFQYNYAVVLILFVGGYLIGLAFEILIYLLRRISHKG